MKELDELVAVSRKYGADKEYVIAGGGNTSYKNGERMWVKASGSALATIDCDGFAVMDRSRLSIISTRTYSTDSAEREREVKNDLSFATIGEGRRPSVETSLHNALKAAYVVHLHPMVVNALLCSVDAESRCKELFGNEALFVPYTDPGYGLFKAVESGVADFEVKFGHQPEIIMLQNHGIFVGVDSVGQIDRIYRHVMSTIGGAIDVKIPSIEESEVDCAADKVIPALRMLLSDRGLVTLTVTNNPLVDYFASSAGNFAKVSRPFTPDHIVYLKSKYIYVGDSDDVVEELRKKIDDYRAANGYSPKVVMIKGIGLIAVGRNAAECKTIAEVFTDMMQIAFASASFGGEHPMSASQIDFIDNWEVENYRRKAASVASAGRVEGKVIIVTGAAQGFGEGIVRNLIGEGANIVVADLNEQTGCRTTESLNAMAKGNAAIFVKTNVADMESLHRLMHLTICRFGGLDIFVSNAGVLRAGGLEQMTPENFEFVTRINYIAYFYCAKVASEVMCLQNSYKADNWGDIVQINSKSGLRGSKANFAYAGGKFGGIGLTQSFALELAPKRVKVNSICPGNFYDGPLWSDPENGLFVQYLRAGKVPGATTVEQVKEFYMAQVPMRRGCSPDDVVKALLYVVDQTCETGQAIPVTGGQVMLA